MEKKYYVGVSYKEDATILCLDVVTDFGSMNRTKGFGDSRMSGIPLTEGDLGEMIFTFETECDARDFITDIRNLDCVLETNFGSYKK